MPQFVVEEPAGFATLGLRRFGRCGQLGPLGVRHVEAGVDHELEPRDAHAIGAVRVDDVLGVRALLRSVGQQFEQRRLMSDERAHPTGMPDDERQTRDGTAAGAEHIRRLGAEIVENRGDVVGTQLGGGVLFGVIDRAACDAARVVGDDGVVACQRVGQWRELRRPHRRADDEQQRTGAANLVVQAGAGDGDRADGGGARQGHTRADCGPVENSSRRIVRR